MFGSLYSMSNDHCFNVWSLDDGICLLTGVLGGIVTIVYQVLFIKCPNCKYRLIWHGLTKDFQYVYLNAVRNCPQCNYPDNKKDQAPQQ